MNQHMIAAVMPALLALASLSEAAVCSNGNLELVLERRRENVEARLSDTSTGQVWAHGPLCYFARLAGATECRGLVDARVEGTVKQLLVTGTLGGSNLRVKHRFTVPRAANCLEEQLTLENCGSTAVRIEDLGCGFRRRLDESLRPWRWVAVPYRRQVDGKLHDYSLSDLSSGKFSNSDWRNDAAVLDQHLSDQGKLRSEAWAWTDSQAGLLINKYNEEMIEYSVAEVEQQNQECWLRFGGAGLALYAEPRQATVLKPGKRIVFGVTRYTVFEGGWQQGYELYRQFLNTHGHGLPRGYHPPLNWNELFDVGWYHSDREQLLKQYTRASLLREAAKAKEIGCDLLYLDPGWEICEGTTLWDEQRLGKVSDFAAELKQRFGLRLGYRTIGRVYRDEFPQTWYMRREGQTGDYHRPSLDAQPGPEPVPLTSPDGRRDLALLPEAGASASSVISGFPELHQIAHLNDGYYNNGASWVSAQDPSWVELDLGAVYRINEIAFGSEHRAWFKDRAVTDFEVSVATRGGGAADSDWKMVYQRRGVPVRGTEHFQFPPVPARWVRVSIKAASGSTARIDELEIYEERPERGALQPVRRAAPQFSGGNPIGFWELCTQCEAWQREKLKRILAITRGGVKFMMFDEFDWRGPCYDSSHGHPVPSAPEGHVRAIYGLVEAVRKRCPDLLVEAHDPVWPWSARYLPTYYRQGFGKAHYQENWGFEFMWNPIEDLRSGRALCLYYYNLGCDIPLYDHITMEADNDACLAFWWYASTVRHLGIGGKKGLNSSAENEARFAAYKHAVADYNRLRPFYARGRFIGLEETVHLHLHPHEPAAVLNVFNLSEQPLRREVRLSSRRLGWKSLQRVEVVGAAWRREEGELVIAFDLPPLTPGLAIVRQRPN